MDEACEAISSKIVEFGGTFEIKMAPKVVTATDEADLAKQLEQAALENLEVSGDDDDDEDEDGENNEKDSNDEEEDDEE